MGRVLAENPKGGLIQHPESDAQDSVGGETVAVEGSRSELNEHVGALVVLLLTAILYFARLGARTLWASEFRWGEIAREMLLTRDYFWPTINGRVYFDKPLASYWLVLGVSRETSSLNEATIRFPSALAG